MVWSLVYLSLLSAVALADSFERRVTNALSLLMWVAGVLFWTTQEGFAGTQKALLGSGVAFASLILFYQGNILGAADVKVFAALGAWLGSGRLAQTLLCSCLWAGVLGLLSLAPLLAQQQGNASKWLRWQNWHVALAQGRRLGSRLPFVAALSLGALAVRR